MDYTFGRFLRRQENVYEKVLEQFFDVEADPCNIRPCRWQHRGHILQKIFDSSRSLK